MMKNLTLLTFVAYFILISWVALSGNSALNEPETENRQIETVSTDERIEQDSAACIDYAKRGCKYRH